MNSTGIAHCMSYGYHYVLEERFYPPLVLFLPVLHFIVNWCGAPASILALTSLETHHNSTALLFACNSILAWIQVQSFTHAGAHTCVRTHKAVCVYSIFKRLSEPIISAKLSLHALERERRGPILVLLQAQNPQPKNKLAKRHRGGIMTIYSICYWVKEGGWIPLFLQTQCHFLDIWDTLKSMKRRRVVLARGKGWKRGLTRMFLCFHGMLTILKQHKEIAYSKMGREIWRLRVLKQGLGVHLCTFCM